MEQRRSRLRTTDHKLPASGKSLLPSPWPRHCSVLVLAPGERFLLLRKHTRPPWAGVSWAAIRNAVPYQGLETWLQTGKYDPVPSSHVKGGSTRGPECLGNTARWLAATINSLEEASNQSLVKTGLPLLLHLEWHLYSPMDPAPSHRGLCTSHEYEGLHTWYGLLPTEGPIKNQTKTNIACCYFKQDTRTKLSEKANVPTHNFKTETSCPAQNLSKVSSEYSVEVTVTQLVVTV